MKMYLSLFALLALAGCGEKAEVSKSTEASKPMAASTEAGVNTAEAAPTVAPEERGRKLFNECAVCHSVRAGDPHRVGPNLHGIAGAKAAAADGFAYSKSLKESSIVWDDASLNAFIESPQTLVRGNRMAYVGQREEAKRADIIAYLKSLK